MNQEEFKILFKRYAAGSCSKEEQVLIQKILLKNPMSNGWQWSSEEQRLLMKIKIKQGIDQQLKKPVRSIKTYWVAASVAAILLLGVCYFLWPYQDITPSTSVQLATATEQETSGIILRTAHGKAIALDSGEQASIQNILESNVEDMGSCTIEVPTGEQFNFALPDGTRVWLNAATKISFPRFFAATERMIQLEGEAYFEVTKNATKPFKVMANGTEVMVHGTHFNVVAYPKEKSVKTTLFEGAVTVRKDQKEMALKPGYEVISAVDRSDMHVQKADLEQAMAWRNGYFIFNDMDVASVMKTVARWYNISVVTDKGLPVKRIGGSFPIAGKLDDLLQDLEFLSGFKFKRTGKEVRIVW
ncbi:FecR family protein [Sphingobacterium multivorum]|uniref:FecR family protein n=1 Tax=Sphingobacterium TaxID=28453 RepID=UPI00257E2898|nr:MULTISPECIES: FecR domain-containing protein [unclassified Sphingobacterium]